MSIVIHAARFLDLEADLTIETQTFEVADSTGLAAAFWARRGGESNRLPELAYFIPSRMTPAAKQKSAGIGFKVVVPEPENLALRPTPGGSPPRVSYAA